MAEVGSEASQSADKGGGAIHDCLEELAVDDVNCLWRQARRIGALAVEFA